MDVKRGVYRVCPQCGSTNLKWDMGGKLGGRYLCMTCGYRGLPVEGNVEFIEKFRKGLERKVG